MTIQQSDPPEESTDEEEEEDAADSEEDSDEAEEVTYREFMTEMFAHGMSEGFPMLVEIAWGEGKDKDEMLVAIQDIARGSRAAFDATHKQTKVLAKGVVALEAIAKSLSAVESHFLTLAKAAAASVAEPEES